MTACCGSAWQRRSRRLSHCMGRHEEDDQAMCGITGIFETRERREIARAVLVRMNESQHHRGPDEVGYHVEPGVGLGHRRLSIIAVATGQQPLFNEDGSVAVIYNGEIYNFQELIPELTALGHTFRTKSDTEVIVHAWGACGSRSRSACDAYPRSRSALSSPVESTRARLSPRWQALLPTPSTHAPLRLPTPLSTKRATHRRSRNDMARAISSTVWRARISISS